MLKKLLQRTVIGLSRPVYGGVGAIYALHRVVPAAQQSKIAENRSLEITPEMLADAIEFLRDKGYHFAALDEVPGLLAKPGKKKFYCFTLDDGYKDNAVYAQPVFRKYGVPFAVNVTISYAEQHGLLWWYVLEHVLAQLRTVRLTTPEGTQELPLGNAAEREAAFNRIAKLVRNGDQAKRDDLIHAIAAQAQVDALALSNRYLMDWRELKEMARDPLATLGAHTVNHYTLGRLDEAAARHEMLASKEQIEAQLGRPVQHFAYPFGGPQAVGPREFALAKACGFRTAVTTRRANLFPAHAAHLECLPRLPFLDDCDRKRLELLDCGYEPARVYGGKRVVTV